MNELQETSSLKRAWEISRVGAKYFIFPNREKRSLGLRLRLACEELGLVFIKLGQILSTRYDLLDRTDCEELQKLLDEVPPMNYETVREIFLNDFGKQPEEIYAEFDPQPVAAASIAQVYKAKLTDGTTVAVKVRRPRVDRAIRADLAISRKLSVVARWFSADLRYIDVENILEQVQGWLMEEVDFTQEAENLEIVVRYQHEKCDILGEYADAIVLPRVYRNFSSSNVVTMEFIEGVPVRQFKTLANDPRYDVFGSLKAFMGAMMRGWMYGESAVFAGDPHPSNLLLLPGGRLGVLDFGLLAKLNKQYIQETRDLLLAVYSQDVEQSIRKSLAMCGVSYEQYADLVRKDMQKYLEKTKTSGMGYWFIGFAKVFMKYRIPFPYQLVLFGRMQAIIEGLFETVAPGVTTLEVFGEELERGLRKQFWENLKDINFPPALYVLSEKMKKSPDLVAGLIDKYLDDPLRAIHDIREALKV